MKIEDFYLLQCKIKNEFLVAMGLTTALKYGNIQVWCKHCNHIHEFTLQKSGNFKVITR